MLQALSHALSGIQSNLSRLDRAADRISLGGARGDLAGNLVELQLAQRGVQANVAAARAVDDTVGTLLDVLG